MVLELGVVGSVEGICMAMRAIVRRKALEPKCAAKIIEKD